MSSRGQHSDVRGSEVVVPGSIANLGPGFDALAVAVTVYLRLRVLDVDPSAPGRLDMEFDGRPPAGENRVAIAYARAAARTARRAPGLRVRVTSEIPMRAGLGSSAAATVAGLRLFEAAAGMEGDLSADWLALATAVEGHPDNAAAALFGGLTLSCQRDTGEVIARTWPWPEALRFVVATPEAELETAFARTVLPGTVPMRDAVHNLQRALLLVHAVGAARYDDLREALRDRWHQPARQPFVPGLAEALALDHPAILGVCLSGAGPSIAAIAAGRVEEAAAELGAIYARLGVPYTIRTLSVEGNGARVHRGRPAEHGGPRDL